MGVNLLRERTSRAVGIGLIFARTSVAGLPASRRDEPPQVASAQASACEDPEQQKTAAVVAVVAQGVYAMNKSRHVTRRSALQLGVMAAHCRSCISAAPLRPAS